MKPHLPRPRPAMPAAWRALGVVALALALSVSAAHGATGMKIPYQTFTLTNGLKVFVHEDHSVPVVTLNTWFLVGSGDEKPGRTGFAHLFEHIMFMGSQHVPTGEFDKLLESAGANSNGSTTFDRTNYYEDGPSNALPLMTWLDSDRLGFLLPEITADKVELQRGVVQNERRQRYENEPYGLAQENILSRLFPAGHPHSWPTIGSMADLNAATIDDVRGFFKQYYTPNNATIAVAGDVKFADVKQQFEKYFGDIPRGPEVPRPTVPEQRLQDDVYATLEDRVQLPRLYYAWRTTRNFGADDAALDAVGQILAGGKSSRLYKRLVYDLQIASQVVAYQFGAKLDGAFQSYATAKPGHDLTELSRIMDEEIRKLAEQGPTERELQRVKNSAEAQFISSLEQVGGFGGKANQLNYYNFYTGNPDGMAQDFERYRALTPADVQRAAKHYLLDGHRVVLSVVPQGQTKLAVTRVTP